MKTVLLIDVDLFFRAKIEALGFGRHTDAHLLRQAREAGFTRVIARSVLAKRLPEVVAALLNPAVPPATSRVERDWTRVRIEEASSG